MNNEPPGPRGPSMMCRACGYGLEDYEQYEGGLLKKVTYRHNYLPPGVPPHDIDPVMRDEATVKGVCDFDLVEAEEFWIYPCRNYNTPLVTTLGKSGLNSTSYGSVGDWGACPQCHEDIEAQRWDEILERSIHANASEEPISPALLAILRSRIKKLHEGFRANRTGPAHSEKAPREL